MTLVFTTLIESFSVSKSFLMKSAERGKINCHEYTLQNIGLIFVVCVSFLFCFACLGFGFLGFVVRFLFVLVFGFFFPSLPEWPLVLIWVLSLTVDFESGTRTLQQMFSNLLELLSCCPPALSCTDSRWRSSFVLVFKIKGGRVFATENEVDFLNFFFLILFLGWPYLDNFFWELKHFSEKNVAA